MKIRKLSLLALFAGLFVNVFAEDAETPRKDIDCTTLRIINKGFDNTERTYSRLPANLRDSIAEGRELWDRQQCSAGLGVRFATDSKKIGVKYDLFWDTHMIHMADTGLKGADLYIFEGDSVWRHVNTIRPYVKKDGDGNKTKHVESTFVSNMDGCMHEYMIYLPLYDSVENLYLVVDSTANVNTGRDDLIDKKRKIVAYGTSILQGGCASRTGMASTNIMSRDLNAEIVNLGFSGEGKMDFYIARAMASIPDVDAYIIDAVPNCTEAMCDSLTYDFVNIIRKAHPDTPIIMVEGPMYTYTPYDDYFRNYLPAKNAAWRRNYEKLMAENPNNLYYVTCEGLDGVEGDGTVDGVHLTDVGFKYYAAKMTPVLRDILGW